MSGTSREREAHRNWESGASKRKRKAGRAVTNEALSMKQDKNSTVPDTVKLTDK